MKTQDIEDVLVVSNILRDATTASETIAALIDWKNSTATTLVLKKDEPAPATKAVAPPVKSAAKGKAKAAAPAEDFEPTPDPSADEPDF